MPPLRCNCQSLCGIRSGYRFPLPPGQVSAVPLARPACACPQLFEATRRINMLPTGVCASEVLSTKNLNMRPTQDLCEIIGRFMIAGEGVVAHWVEYAKGLLLFVMAPGDDRSGEFYVYDRKKGS